MATPQTAEDIRKLVLNPLIEISGELSACLSRMEKQHAAGLLLEGGKIPVPLPGALRALDALRMFRRNLMDFQQSADDRTLSARWREAARKSAERDAKRDTATAARPPAAKKSVRKK